jgi:hypothetical protein
MSTENGGLQLVTETWGSKTRQPLELRKVKEISRAPLGLYKEDMYLRKEGKKTWLHQRRRILGLTHVVSVQEVDEESPSKVISIVPFTHRKVVKLAA